MSFGWSDQLSLIYGWWDADDDDEKYFTEAFNQLAKDILEELAKLPNVIIVTAAGNPDGPGEAVDLYPALFGFDPIVNGKLVVVGGFNPYTGRKCGRTAPFVKVSAPGYFVNVAARYENGRLLQPSINEAVADPTPLQKELQLQFAEGTSFASPTVAGQIAVWLSAGMPFNDVIPYLYRTAHSRVRNGPKVLFNGIDIDRWPRELWPNWYKEGNPPVVPQRLQRFHPTRLSKLPDMSELIIRTRNDAGHGQSTHLVTEILTPLRTIFVSNNPLKTVYKEARPGGSTAISTISRSGIAIKTKYSHYKRGETPHPTILPNPETLVTQRSST
ncbi:hypothetical protein ABW20_dc0106301 [Dactylellina cionopaga]|nr:hypothetical protein ABW20_dc0106301 [Dactylellina cionopaga]